MAQINIRISEEEKSLISEMATAAGLSTSEFVKRAVMNDINHVRLEVIFDLVAKGKIGRKRAWKLSGLTYYEFLREWTERKALEKLPEELLDEALTEALKFDPTPFLKTL